MARRFDGSSGIEFAISPLSGYTAGPITLAVLMKRAAVSATETPINIFTSAFGNRVLLLCDPLALYAGANGGSGYVPNSTSVWFLLAATWAGGAAVPRFHVHDGTSWTHMNRTTGSNSNATIAGTDQIHVGYRAGGTGSYDVVCAGIKKADRTDAQIETLSPLAFQAWRDFSFDWLIGFDASLTTSGAYQDQASPGTGNEIAKTGTTAVADPSGWKWSNAPAFRSSSSAQTGGTASSISVPIPAGVIAGDVLVMVLHSFKGGGSPAAHTVSGWTQRAQNTAAADNFAVFSRVADGTEGANATVASSPNAAMLVGILAYSGGTGVDAFADPGFLSTTATPTVPSLTTTVANAMVIGLVSSHDGTSATPASGWTERLDVAGSAFADLIYAMERAQAAAGASPTAQPTLTGTGGAGKWPYAIAIAPVPGAPPVADFTGTPTSGSATLAVTFTDSSTNTPTSWAWDFGDGSTSSSQNPSHSYTSSGVYTVSLTATNTAGSNTKTRTAYITVSEAVVYAAGGGIDIY